MFQRGIWAVYAWIHRHPAGDGPANITHRHSLYGLRTSPERQGTRTLLRKYSDSPGCVLPGCDAGGGCDSLRRAFRSRARWPFEDDGRLVRGDRVDHAARICAACLLCAAKAESSPRIRCMYWNTANSRIASDGPARPVVIRDRLLVDWLDLRACGCRVAVV